MSANRILLVDDEPDILESLQSLLEAVLEDITIETSPSAEDAVKRIGENFDLIISDFKMPGMNGVEFLSFVKEKKPDTPRILMTAFPDLQIAMDAINEAGIQTFVTKPLDPTEIIDMVKGILDKHRAETQRKQAFARAMNAARPKKEDEK